MLHSAAYKFVAVRFSPTLSWPLVIFRDIDIANLPGVWRLAWASEAFRKGWSPKLSQVTVPCLGPLNPHTFRILNHRKFHGLPHYTTHLMLNADLIRETTCEGHGNHEQKPWRRWSGSQPLRWHVRLRSTGALTADGSADVVIVFLSFEQGDCFGW